jgi:hypothetical protein
MYSLERVEKKTGTKWDRDQPGHATVAEGNALKRTRETRPLLTHE